MLKVRKAILKDIPRMQQIAQNEVKKGIILPRSDDEIATNIRSYTLIEIEDKIVGFGALHIYSPNLAEIRSLVVDEEYRGRGVGKEVVQKLLKEAKELGVKEVLVLTYEPQFFKKLGFMEIEKEKVPDHKIWTDCIKCVHFPICNEISLIYKIK
ncbi:MAG: N-acetyltransferase [Epsilonproteobacteria bacterium]|nr:N-acetyltransferase [Campylobacterota bacterium]